MCSELKEFKSIILPFIQTEEGRKMINGYYNLIVKNYPWYVDEMRGISIGSEINFNWIMAINIRVELMHIVSSQNDLELKTKRDQETLKECSDFMLFDEENNFIIHNEDAAPSIYKSAYLVSCKITSSDYQGVNSPEEEFTCYCYPGHLPGNAFGFNSTGFVFGVNATYPKLMVTNSFPRQILNRLMLSAKNLKELEKILLTVPCSYGFCMNIGYVGDDQRCIETDWNSEFFGENTNNFDQIVPHLFNYEIAPDENSGNKVSKHCVISPKMLSSVNNENNFYTSQYYYHFNHYERIEIEEVLNKSSKRRKERIEVIDAPTSLKDLLDISSDTCDSNYPIFRTPRKNDPSELQTIATALFDLNSKTLSIFVKKPSDNYQPL
ncbi:acyl-coenzyme A:6-aminopenicillanic-acid-acyltransferase 40 kDa form-like, partial [Brachionus plicatilis]